MPNQNILQTIQGYFTLAHRMDEMSDQYVTYFTRATARFEALERHVADLRERVARVEAQREADIAQMRAEVAAFKLEVERAALDQSRRIPKPPQDEPH